MVGPWKLYIDSPQKRALHSCCGSLTEGDGWGPGDCYGDLWGDGYGDGYGEGDGKGAVGESYVGDRGDGYGWGNGDGGRANGW